MSEIKEEKEVRKKGPPPLPKHIRDQIAEKNAPIREIARELWRRGYNTEQIAHYTHRDVTQVKQWVIAVNKQIREQLGAPIIKDKHNLTLPQSVLLNIEHWQATAGDVRELVRKQIGGSYSQSLQALIRIVSSCHDILVQKSYDKERVEEGELIIDRVPLKPKDYKALADVIDKVTLRIAAMGGITHGVVRPEEDKPAPSQHIHLHGAGARGKASKKRAKSLNSDIIEGETMARKLLEDT